MDVRGALWQVLTHISLLCDAAASTLATVPALHSRMHCIRIASGGRGTGRHCSAAGAGIDPTLRQRAAPPSRQRAAPALRRLCGSPVAA